MTRAHKLHHLHHGLNRLKIGLGVALVPFNIGAMVLLQAHGEQGAMPAPIWVAALAALLGGFMLKWQVYRSKGCRPADAFGALIAAKALSHRITMASLRAALGRPASWRRTSNFRPAPRRFGGLAAARGELANGLAALFLPAAALVVLPRSALLNLLLFAVLRQSLSFLAAPTMAVLSERHVRAVQREQPVAEAKNGRETDNVEAAVVR